MLRRMSFRRRVVSRTLTLSCALLGAAAPLACQQVQDMMGGKTEEKKADVPVTPPPPVVATPTPPVTVVPVPGVVTLDSLLALVQSESTGMFVVLRQPGALLDLGDEAFKFYDAPVQELVALLGAQEVASGFAMAKTGLGELRSKLSGSGVDLGRGIVITQTGVGNASTVILVSAAQADQVKGLMTALKIPDADKTICKAIDAAPGYIGCADSEAVLAAYKPGDAARRRQAIEARLPGVTLEDLTMIGFAPDDGGVHVALAMPPGAGVLHVGLAAASEDTKDARALLDPGPATTLRFARPGTGFMWMRADMAEMKKRQPELASAPAPFDAAIAAWNGEMYFGGSSDPAAMQLRLGLSDVKPAATAMDTAAKAMAAGLPKTIPGLPGSKVAFETRDLTIGAETVKASHITVTGLEQASVISHLLGLSLDAWIFAADNSLAFALGADPTGIARLTGTASADATLATLPAAAAEDLRAGRASFVMQMPLDALQGPTLRKALDAALKNVAGYKPEQARTGMALLSPLSSGTMWITEQNDMVVVHMAITGIGHTADDEGKAALAAAVAVAGGGDPAALFGELVSKFPASPRLAAYQARAGTTGAGVLTGSAVGSMVLTGAIVWSAIMGSTNKDLAAELGVPAEAPKTEKPKTETPKTETPKTEKPKTDPPKTEKPKTDPPKTEPPKTTPPKTDPPKTEPPKTTPPKADPPKVDPTKPKPAELKFPTRKPRDPATK